MSIPSYQFPSLEGENVAKRRVMAKAKKGFETEEQRAVKSGQVDDSIKNVYQMILANHSTLFQDQPPFGATMYQV